MASNLLPILDIGVFFRRMGPIRDQSMRVPTIAIIGNGVRAQRPRSLCTHVAKYALGERDKIRAVRSVGLAQFQRAMGSIFAGDDLTSHGRGPSPDRALRRRAHALGHRAFAVPETIRLPGLVHVVFEDHGWEVAVVVGALILAVGQVGEVLHVDLHGGWADVVGVVLVEPGAGGLVAVVTDDDVGIRPIAATLLAHVAKPATLGTVGPFLGDLCDTESVFTRVDLNVGWLLTW